MKRVWGHLLAGLSVAAGGALASSACVHNDSTLFVHDVLAPQTASSNTMLCSFTADPMQPSISSGTLDIALRRRYDAMFLVANQMVPEVNGSQLQTETSIVTIQGAIVRVTSGSQQLANYTRLAAATIPPLSGNTPGFAAVGYVLIIDENTVDSVPTAATLNMKIPDFLISHPDAVIRLVSHVRFFGATLGGQSVESDEFEFPVDVCWGCLISFTNNPRYQTPNCVGNAAGGGSSSQSVVPCLFGQDLAVDCNACQDRTICQGASQGSPAPADGGAG